MNVLYEATKPWLRKDLPPMGSGDIVKVHVRVKEGAKERIQIFEGIIISRKGSGVHETITVRKISGGIGVERIFPLHTPAVAKFEVVRRRPRKRAKLYYLRSLKGKAFRLAEKR